MAKKLAPMHPGEVLREEFLLPLNLSAGALAKACDLSRTRIERIAAETTGITADTALRLGKALGTSAQLWMNLQNRYGHNDQLRASVVGVWRLDRLAAYSLSSSMTNSRHGF